MKRTAILTVRALVKLPATGRYLRDPVERHALPQGAAQSDLIMTKWMLRSFARPRSTLKACSHTSSRRAYGCSLAKGSSHCEARQGAIGVAGGLGEGPIFLIGSQDTGLHDETVAACRAAGFMPRLGQPAPRITSTLNLVAAGLGIALIPSTMQSVRIAGIVYRRLRPPVPKAFLGLAFRRGDPSPVLKQFLNVVRTIKTAFLHRLRGDRHGQNSRQIVRLNRLQVELPAPRE
jgi:hypothetical protein